MLSPFSHYFSMRVSLPIFSRILLLLNVLIILQFSEACPLESSQPLKRTARKQRILNTLNQNGKLLKSINIPTKYAGRNIRFGDLTGDGKSEIVVAQNRGGQHVTHVLAMDLAGKILWTWGKSILGAYHSPRDLGVQIYDWDGDGKSEVLILQQNQLYLLNGLDGSLIQQVEVDSNERDVIFIANLLSSDHPALLLKSRYYSFSIYDHTFTKIYSTGLNTGHFPMAYDFNNDGIDELLIGYSLFDFTNISNPLVWSHPEIPMHNDAIDIGDMQNDGQKTISYAASGNGYLLNPDGEILQTFKMRHAQHTTFGHFQGKPEQEVAYVDRNRLGIVKIIDADNHKLWKSEPFGFLTMINTVDGWNGAKDQSFLLVSRTDVTDPALYNARGKLIAKFPFPPARLPSRRYDEHYTQHFDILGDCREEVIVYNEKSIWIYGNPKIFNGICNTSEKLPNNRISRASFYTGFQ